MAALILEEIWKPVVGNADYEVSSIGRVKRVTTARGATAGRILRASVGSHGYYGVNLGRNNHHLVHRLMANAFLPTVPGRTHVNHVNGVKTDNRITNLEWSNKSLNQIHAMGLGLYNGPPHRPGIHNGNAKLTEETVREIRRLRAGGMTYAAVGAAMGIPTMTAFHACKIGWKTVT